MLLEQSRLMSGPGEDNVGIPDDLRCKRSDGKQWRCTAMSMPDKTVCEKHYIQAKKRAANSAMRASMKKAKRKSSLLGESSEIYLESKSDDMDVPLANMGFGGDYSGKKKYKERVSRGASYSPEMPSMRSYSARNSSLRSSDEFERDADEYEESQRSYRTTPPSAMESPRNRSRAMLDSSPMTGSSHGSSDSSEDTGGQPCHQCRRNDRDRVLWCLKCDRRGYCDNCISTWYSDIPLEDLQQVCPACRGTCSCRVCLRGDNLIKVRIREIPAQDKLEYLYSLLAAVLPVVKNIHQQQCSEVELENQLQGNQIDLNRTKLNADEQMCCDFCRIPIIDYHRHCSNCSYDLCLRCCKDIREASRSANTGEMGNEVAEGSLDRGSALEQARVSNIELRLLEKFSDWKANNSGSIPCPPKEYGGCGSAILSLKRIFKMNWVAKLVKNVEEMVSGCKLCESSRPEETESDRRLCQASHRENDDDDNFLYHPSCEDIKTEGIWVFRNHWSRGKPVIVKEVCDSSSMAVWDPKVIWRGIRETEDEKMKDDNRMVKAIDCLDWTEIDIELGKFIKGYSEGRVHENGWPEMLKLKDWPSSSASEEFLMCQRPDFISKLPLLEFIHSKWGLLNVAAKLPHYSLQNDVGPKIFISYGTHEELGRGDAVHNLHVNMRDLVFLLVHVNEVNSKQMTKIQNRQEVSENSDGKELSATTERLSEAGGSSKTGGQDGLEKCESDLDSNDIDLDNQVSESASTHVKETIKRDKSSTCSSVFLEKACSGARWDVFRREDVPKLVEFLRIHWEEFTKPETAETGSVSRPLYDGIIYLNRDHKGKLKEEFGVEPWSFQQHVGEAVFIPAGCPFQVRDLQPNVQLGLDFLSPESLKEAVRLGEEIRGLPNDHDAKLQILEVGKISLYAASSAIKEVQKLVLDSKVGPELGFEDPNLTALVSENLEKMIKRRQITCV